jgi:RNA polymerase sigma-70 factor (ECF subfamily)
MPSEDTQIAKGVRAGDTAVFDRLFRCYAERVMGFALRLTRSPAEAEDLLQEVFVAAYAGRASYAGRAKPLAWLLGIASRRWRDKNRGLAKEAPVPLIEETLEAGLSSKSFEESVVDQLALTRALDRLDEPFREALLLVASQGLTYKEAAVATGEPVGTVKWRVYEASRRMRSFLTEQEEETHEVRR